MSGTAGQDGVGNAQADEDALNRASPREMANVIRVLAMDAVQQANSGHPGMPMGMADVATVLFTRFLRYYPGDPDWPDRDRFVLSAGHGSMLLYALLHLTGYPGMDMDQLRNFRQLGSKTAGHPEYGHAPGIETTTGPLGQGLANAVGMALAERMLAERYGSELVDHHTYVIAGDGCLMEGISHEAISLAGHLKLDRLVVLFDDNSISIDGPVDLACRDDQLKRFEASGWMVSRIDGHDHEQIAGALTDAWASDKPTLIACRTLIGFGAPNKQGTAATHGAPLGAEEIAAARAELGWDEPPFSIPEHIAEAWAAAGRRCLPYYAQWQARLALQGEQGGAELETLLSGRLPAALPTAIADLKQGFSSDAPKLATRVASQQVLEKLAEEVPNLVGGSADLTGSNNTKAKAQEPVTPGAYGGRYIHWGVREHAMAAAMNGMALHGGFIPYGGTFLVFSDYSRPAIRLAALMGIRVIHVLTHDSIGLGEDGPTHQPVEHLASLRAIPNLDVFRPCDGVETAECWALAIARGDGPSALALTRQGLPTVRTTAERENRCARGAYVLAPAQGARRVTLLASGSEVQLALEAQARLQEEGIGAAVVSVPCLDRFKAQDEAYQADVLGDPAGVRVVIEAGIVQGWEGLLGANGAFVGMSSFGASAPQDDLFQHFGITTEAVLEAAKARLG